MCVCGGDSGLQHICLCTALSFSLSHAPRMAYRPLGSTEGGAPEASLPRTPLQCFGAEMEGMHFGNPCIITTETQGMPLFSLMGSPRCKGLVAFPKGSRAHVSGLPHFISSHPLCCVCVYVRVYTRAHMHACMCVPMCMNSGASFQCVTCISHFCMIYSSAYSMGCTHTSCSRHIR